MERNCKPQKPVLNCTPTEFISAATELLDESEFCSEWKIMDQNRKIIDVNTALELQFNLPEEENEAGGGGGSDRR